MAMASPIWSPWRRATTASQSRWERQMVLSAHQSLIRPVRRRLRSPWGDFNGDGNRDLAVTNGNCVYVYPSFNCGSGTVSILLGNGDGTFRSHLTTLLVSSLLRWRRGISMEAASSI